MKIRYNFISNSSSASFVVFKQNLKDSTINKVLNPKYFAEQLNKQGFNFYPDDSWEIEETETYIKGFTVIDNFPMDEYFKALGLKEKINFIYKGE